MQHEYRPFIPKSFIMKLLSDDSASIYRFAAVERVFNYEVLQSFKTSFSQFKLLFRTLNSFSYNAIPLLELFERLM